MFRVLGTHTPRSTVDHHITTFDPEDPHATPAYDGHPSTAWKHLDPGHYLGTYTNPHGDVWSATLVVAPDGKFSHVVPHQRVKEA
jgi:hypothetical protein